MPWHKPLAWFYHGTGKITSLREFVKKHNRSLVKKDTDSNPTIENWCDEGGIWDDGRCGQGNLAEQAWHWMCGWYMAQVDNGVFTIAELRVNVPLCASLYPPLIQENTTSTTNACVPISGFDSDCDDLPDAWELTYFGTLAQSANDDPDNDACDNLCEFLMGTNPGGLDTDDDGLLDNAEISVYFTDPLNPDTDADGLKDGIEVHNLGTNPLSQDTDGDSVTDNTDTCPTVFGTVLNNGCP